MQHIVNECGIILNVCSEETVITPYGFWYPGAEHSKCSLIQFGSTNLQWVTINCTAVMGKPYTPILSTYAERQSSWNLFPEEPNLCNLKTHRQQWKYQSPNKWIFIDTENLVRMNQLFELHGLSLQKNLLCSQAQTWPL